ncbi:unnamed protein product [Aspergillus oryzae]|nr:unnamed protein product [Aspergillus oryzae]
MSNVLITGSSRGLGLELVRQLASGECQGGIVIAAARKCSPELRDLISHSHGSVVFVPLDLTDERAITKSVTAVQSALKEKSLDVLINCAGVHSETQGKLVHMYDSYSSPSSQKFNLINPTGVTWTITCRDMGGMNADLTLPQGADAVLNVILAADCTDNGRFKNIHVPGWEAYNGEDVPW